MFRKILLATDGSDHAIRAAETALSLMKSLSESSSITLLHISASVPARSEILQANFDVHTLLETKAHQAIKSTEEKFKDEGISYKLDVALGDPAKEIIKHAQEGNYNLIIVGSRGLGTIGEMLLGSVSHDVLHHAHCPVLIVK